MRRRWRLHARRGMGWPRIARMETNVAGEDQFGLYRQGPTQRPIRFLQVGVDFRNNSTPLINPHEVTVMSIRDWTESEIQALKAQEAKDLAIEFLHALEEKERGPISPGEVQLRELEYELKLKQAEAEDAKLQRSHIERMQELELQLEQERSKTTAARSQADQVRQELQDLAERVRASEESLAVSLERSTREHRLALERLEQEFESRREQLENEQAELTERRDALVDQIQDLTQLNLAATELSEIREAIHTQQSALAGQRQEIDEELGTLEFRRKKVKSENQQQQELELAKIRHEHEKKVLQLERETADRILEGLKLVAIDASELDDMRKQIADLRASLEHQTALDESEARQRFCREYNITGTEPVDVTSLHYELKAASSQATQMNKRIQQLEAELSASREHIQGEPQRIAAAVETARTPIQNIVEPASKR